MIHDPDSRIRRQLSTRAMRVEELAAGTGLDPADVRDSLDRLIREGRVRRLRPVLHPGADQDFYRLVRDTDTKMRQICLMLR